ncbi:MULTISPECIES: hypothetical protein [unclassified Campylobacter]|uniref:hypothetical protein n=1 Tax=unclassified Campylobacter TaxID=2593542 RepID=UPI001238230C|nr:MULTISPECIES: hypothetical protein [unclassified Campylobacter]KAA6224779.1 hypothetical protein FMM54_07010 [Campylobacter sp. LR185c]KAA6227354.1 hypothetical protein FMM55_03155 [Campylobacter sp. LR196d]KAA6228731.1 hypothetical protein FMM57_02370 [Campylobacter sp. LR286c]KAA6229541.1 hypothetical protein FMM56_08325 [Campylobacter sp. LR264d]KAA6230785.1 hypothetical protein FMM58_05080 [Campylobacter sp. LR291e]
MMGRNKLLIFLSVLILKNSIKNHPFNIEEIPMTKLHNTLLDYQKIAILVTHAEDRVEEKKLFNDVLIRTLNMMKDASLLYFQTKIIKDDKGKNNIVLTKLKMAENGLRLYELYQNDQKSSSFVDDDKLKNLSYQGIKKYILDKNIEKEYVYNE